ncbi:hypothetical protein [Candidatus Williamhamiltonella defendens]|uniref:Uncharacterized protein n=1 Tax=Candidatus Williamhamiltonella defendens TaxID=138072 RepID=A0A2D3TCX7_9ENTR|nr:hypothetical protein [Candidatus Hamiltonella defensa]ATW33667.1 hypothetical protein BJP43_04535 [Candidatus Hamiltonella defensa]
MNLVGNRLNEVSQKLSGGHQTNSVKKNNKGIPKKVTESASQTKAEKETELDKTISGLNKTVEKIEKNQKKKAIKHNV